MRANLPIAVLWFAACALSACGDGGARAPSDASAPEPNARAPLSAGRADPADATEAERSAKPLRPGGRAAGEDAAPAPGAWHRAHAADDADLTDAQRQQVQSLEALGYLSGSSAGTGESGVRRHDRERAQPGLNLYVSGHGPEARLIDMDGAPVHRWRCELTRAWPELAGSPEAERTTAAYWRRVALCPDGGLLAIFAGIGMLRLDRDSELLWTSRLGEHHDLEVQADGRIVVLTRVAHLLPRIDAETPILEDFVSVLAADGQELRRVSLLESLENSRFDGLLDKQPKGSSYLFHANTVTVLDEVAAGAHPDFAAGQVLVSMRALNTIAVVDLEASAVVWAQRGPFKRQHDPHVLPGGQILLFDNSGLGQRSRVIELDPVSAALGWSYAGSDTEPLYSQFNGTCERLANGNTLIAESNAGRALEVNPDGEIVWEFLSPHVAGADGEFVATLFDVVRIPADAWRPR